MNKKTNIYPDFYMEFKDKYYVFNVLQINRLPYVQTLEVQNIPFLTNECYYIPCKNGVSISHYSKDTVYIFFPTRSNGYKCMNQYYKTNLPDSPSEANLDELISIHSNISYNDKEMEVLLPKNELPELAKIIKPRQVNVAHNKRQPKLKKAEKQKLLDFMNQYSDGELVYIIHSFVNKYARVNPSSTPHLSTLQYIYTNGKLDDLIEFSKKLKV